MITPSAAPRLAGDGAAVDEGAADVTFEVTVPEGVKPGDKLQATTPGGVKVKLAVDGGAPRRADAPRTQAREKERSIPMDAWLSQIPQQERRRRQPAPASCRSQHRWHLQF